MLTGSAGYCELLKKQICAAHKLHIHNRALVFGQVRESRLLNDVEKTHNEVLLTIVHNEHFKAAASQISKKSLAVILINLAAAQANLLLEHMVGKIGVIFFFREYVRSWFLIFVVQIAAVSCGGKCGVNNVIVFKAFENLGINLFVLAEFADKFLKFFHNSSPYLSDI